MLAQLLSADALRALREMGAVEHELDDRPAANGDRFTVVAARGGDDIWIELRRHRRLRAAMAAAAAAPGPVAAAGPVPPPSVEVPPAPRSRSAGWRYRARRGRRRCGRRRPRSGRRGPRSRPRHAFLSQPYATSRCPWRLRAPGPGPGRGAHRAGRPSRRGHGATRTRPRRAPDVASADARIRAAAQPVRRRRRVVAARRAGAGACPRAGCRAARRLPPRTGASGSARPAPECAATGALRAALTRIGPLRNSRPAAHAARAPAGLRR